MVDFRGVTAKRSARTSFGCRRRLRLTSAIAPRHGCRSPSRTRRPGNAKGGPCGPPFAVIRLSLGSGGAGLRDRAQLAHRRELGLGRGGAAARRGTRRSRPCVNA